MAQNIYGIIAEFESPTALHKAAEKVRDEGYIKWDVYSPFPIHGMDDAMGLKRSRLPWFVFFGGAFGLLIGFLTAYSTQVGFGFDFFPGYPTVVQGKPTNMNTISAFFPIMFELTILLSAFTTLFMLLFLMRLPRHYHPLFESEAFSKKTTDDGFFVAIEARDPIFSEAQTKALLESSGGKNLALIKEAEAES